MPDISPTRHWNSDDNDNELNYSVQVNHPSLDESTVAHDQQSVTRDNNSEAGFHVKIHETLVPASCIPVAREEVVPLPPAGGSIPQNVAVVPDGLEYLDDFQEKLLVCFNSGVQNLVKDLDRSSDDVKNINSEVVAVHRDLNKLLPLSNDINLLRNSVESTHSDVTMVTSGMAQVHSDVRDIKSDVMKTEKEMSNVKTHVLGSRQEVMNLKEENHGLKRKVVAIKIVSDGINENVSGGRVDLQSMHSDLKLLKDDCQQTTVSVESLRTNVAGVQRDVATLKVEMSKVRSDMGSVKQTVETLHRNIEAMKAVLLPPTVVGVISTQTGPEGFEIKTDPGTIDEEPPASQALFDMSSIRYSAVSSPNTSEVTFKPNLDTRTYHKSSTPEHLDERADDTGPNEISDTGISQQSPESQATDKPTAPENAGNNDSSTDEQRSAFLNQEYILASVRKFQASHTAMDSAGPAKDNLTVPHNTPPRKQSRRTAKRGRRD